MKVIKMLDDFALMVNEAQATSYFEAYEFYTDRYKALFNNVFEGLYMQPIEALKPMIETTNFSRLLANGIKNRENGMEEKIIEFTSEVAQWYGFDDGFDLYLGMELGNIGGFVGEPVGDHPFLFIGLDQPRNENHFQQLVAHEFNHMVRFWELARGIKFTEIDFTNRVIAEGLGVYAGLVFDNLPFTLKNFADHNALVEDQYQNLLSNEAQLCADVRKHFGVAMSQELNRTYMMGGLDADNWQKGYYYGTKIINSLVESGYSLKDLTIMPAEEIVNRYDSLK